MNSSVILIKIYYNCNCQNAIFKSQQKQAGFSGVCGIVTRRVEIIRHSLNSQPTEESLRKYQQEALTLSVEFEHWISVL